MEIDIGDLCTHCGRDTTFNSGNGLFVNRIPSGASGKLILDGGDDVTLDVELDGYMCPECLEEDVEEPQMYEDIPDSPSLEDDSYYGTLIDIQNHELGER